MSIQDQVFYPGLWTDQDKANIINHPVWPIVLSMHFNFDKKLFLLYCQNGPMTKFVMGTETGISVLAIAYSIIAKEYKLYFLDNNIIPIIKSKDFMTSGNVKYINNNLIKEGDVRNKIKKSIENLDNYTMSALLSDCINTYKNQYPKPSIIQPYFSNEKAAWALKMLYEDNTLLKVPDHIKQDFEKTYKQMVDSGKALKSYFSKVITFFNKDKWLVGRGHDNYIFVCCIDTSCMVKMIVENTSNAVCFFKEPLRLYKDYNAIDPKIRDKLMAALSFHKVTREADNNKTICVDTEGLIPAHQNVWVDTDAISWDSGWFMCDRLAEDEISTV